MLRGKLFSYGSSKKAYPKTIKLIVFGYVTPELKEELMSLVDGKKIKYVGWIETEDSCQYFAAADLVAFPGRQSFFWKQVVSQGIPMALKWWKGTTHVDLSGDVKFIYDDSIEDIFKILTNITTDGNFYSSMYKAAKKIIANFYIHT